VLSSGRYSPHRPQQVFVPWQVVLQQATNLLLQSVSAVQGVEQNWLPPWSVAQYWPDTVQSEGGKEQPWWFSSSLGTQT